MFFFLSSAVDVPYDSDEEADYSKMDLVCDKLSASSSFFLEHKTQMGKRFNLPLEWMPVLSPNQLDLSKAST